MSFADDESSVQDSRPIELFEFQFATGGVYRYASWPHDVNYLGVPYVARTVRRGVLQVVSGIQNIPALTIELIATDDVVTKYAGVGVPPQSLYVTVRRLQQRSGEVEQQWAGYVDECAFRSSSNKGRTAVFSVSPATDRPITTSIPRVVVSRLCNHVLGDSFCTVVLSQISPTISSLSGTTMVVSTIGGFTATDFKFGRVQHRVTREWRSIADQGGAGGKTMTIDVAWPSTVVPGDDLTLFPGCDHTIGQCRTRYGNVPNFGGHPHIKSANFFWNDIRRIVGA